MDLSLRLLVVGADPLARAGLAALLGGTPAARVVADAAPTDLGRAVAEHAPGVVVWDAGPGGEVRAADVPADRPVVMLVADAEAAADALAAGVAGVLPRDAEAPRLLAAAHAAAAGLLVVEAAWGAALRPRPTSLAADTLTRREHDVLEHLAMGLSNKEIAQRLGISEHTAKFHVVAILAKLGAQTRTEAVMLAARMGLVPL